MTKLNKCIAILTFLLTSILLSIKHTSSSDLITPFSTLTTISQNISNNYSQVVNGYIYSLGGANNSVPQVFIYNTLKADGSLNDWQNINSQLPGRYWHAGVNLNGYIYLMGGNDESINNINSVISGKINENGNIDSWQSLNSLPQTLSIGAAAIYNNTIYYAGGVTDAHFMYQTAQNTIYVASVNSDGTIGTWTIAGQLTQPNFGMKVIAIGNYLYEIGGYNNAGGNTYVRRAIINSDGTIGTWEEQPTLPESIAMFGLAKVQNYLFVVGGDSAGQTDKIYYSQINSDNSLFSWTLSTNKLPKNVGNNAVAVDGNRIYSIGGYNSSEGYLNDVFMTTVQIPEASNTPTPSPSPSPSITPSPTPTIPPSPSPTEIPINKVVFAPGLGGSWNLDAIINCKTSNYSGNWELAPFAKQVYQPFFDAMGNTNWKLKTFYYDWRRDVRDNGSLLVNFINTNTLDTEKVNFVGHSMGGLVGRAYMESNEGGKFNSYFSVGTPHQGAVDAYLAVNKEVWNNNLAQKIAETVLIKRCGAPSSLKNLLPTFDYLKTNNQVKPVSQMKAKNNYLPSNFNIPYWGVKVGTLSGNNFDTLRFLKVKNNWFWTDGKPVSKEYSKQGDGTVLLTSSQLPNAENVVIDQTHAGIIGSTQGTNKILEFLGSEPVEDPPFYEPKSALVIIGYPGNFWIKDKKGKVTQSDKGVITIFDPKTQDLDFKFIPQSPNTLLIVAQFLPNGEVKYKEYKHKGYMPIQKKIKFNLEHPKEDICN